MKKYEVNCFDDLIISENGVQVAYIHGVDDRIKVLVDDHNDLEDRVKALQDSNRALDVDNMALRKSLSESQEAERYANLGSGDKRMELWCSVFILKDSAAADAAIDQFNERFS